MATDDQQPQREMPINQILNLFGGPSEIAELLNCSQPAVSQWYQKIPLKAAILLQQYAYYNQITWHGMEITLELLVPEIFDEGERLGLIPPVEE